jgi:hypothetical protein
MPNYSPTSDEFDGPDSFDFWRLCDEVTVMQAALLTINVNPERSEGVYCEDWKPEERPMGYEAAKTAIIAAVKRGKVEGTLVPIFDCDINGNMSFPIEGSINVKESMVDVESLRAYFEKKGLKSGFFATKTTGRPDYLNPTNSRYAPKLAAAIGAWLAVTSPGKKSPKQALEKWLREHAAEYGLVDDDGNPVNQAVEDCSKVANWSQTGGAPKSSDT